MSLRIATACFRLRWRHGLSGLPSSSSCGYFTTEQTQRLRLYLVTYLRIVEGAYRQSVLGVIEQDHYIFTSRIFSWAFLTDQWPTLQLNFEQSFVEFLETQIFP